MLQCFFYYGQHKIITFTYKIPIPFYFVEFINKIYSYYNQYTYHFLIVLMLRITIFSVFFSHKKFGNRERSNSAVNIQIVFIFYDRLSLGFKKIIQIGGTDFIVIYINIIHCGSMYISCKKVIEEFQINI